MDSPLTHFPVTMDVSNRCACVQQAEAILDVVRPDFQKPYHHQFFAESYTNTIVGLWGTIPGKYDKVLFRIFGNKTELIIDRSAELRHLRALHSAGCAPPVYGSFNNGFVYGFVPGQPLTPKTAAEKHNVQLIAKAMARMHKALPPIDKVKPFVVRKIQDFIHMLTADNDSLCVPAQYPLLDLNKEAKFIESTITDPNVPMVLCHNDPQPGNIIYDKEKDEMNFIDFEYCSFNYFTYDLADHFCEFIGIEKLDFTRFPNKQFITKWLKVYLKWWNEDIQNNNHHHIRAIGTSDCNIEKFVQHIYKCAAAAHFMWSLWSLIQARHSSIEFDYVQYGKLRMEEYFRMKEKIVSSAF